MQAPWALIYIVPTCLQRGIEEQLNIFLNSINLDIVSGIINDLHAKIIVLGWCII
jgi:hypothetical protein